MKKHTCCFSGHRGLPEQELPAIQALLKEQIVALIKRGVVQFCTGGALGFDTLAAIAVLDLKEHFPQIRLSLFLPCQDQASLWREKQDIDLYDYILNQADSVSYACERYTKWCMFARNRMLVDHSAYCICYMTKPSGGTAYTVNYAQKKGLRVINLANV